MPTRRLAWPLRLGVLSLAFSLIAGCATYRDDLDRAMGHYNANEYDRSLVLLEVLEPDLDSLSSAQRTQYEYYRGMAHFRLNQKYHARHWLGRSAAREKAHEGSLSVEEKGRLDNTLGKLNQERYGDATLTGASSCTVKEDCSDGEGCVDGKCQKAVAGTDQAVGDGAAKDGDGPNVPAPDKKDAADAAAK